MSSQHSSNHISSCVQLRSALKKPLGPTTKIIFTGAGNCDVYNITAPFLSGGKIVIAGRVEPRHLEHAQIAFFSPQDHLWAPIPDAPILQGLQDPCVTMIHDELIIGGVRYPVCLSDNSIGWRMEFYRGKTIQSLRHFLSGPDKMKDIRLVELPNGQVGVFSRPQGVVGGRGRIGFTTVESISNLNADIIQNAPLLPRQCPEDEWVGANEIHCLKNGLLGVLGHIACFDEGTDYRHYYAMCFALNPKTGHTSALRMIAERKFFPKGDSKRADLEDVIFSGGLIRNEDGSAVLYAGLGDAEAGSVRIQDPFTDFEKAESPDGLLY